MIVQMRPFVDNPKSGGVLQHIAAITAELRSRGVEVTAKPHPDAIVHVHAAERGIVPDVYTNHGVHPNEDTPWKKAQNKNIRDNYRLAKEIIAVSEHTACNLVDVCGFKREIRVAYNGVSPIEFMPDIRNSWREELGIGNRKLVLWPKSVVSDVCDPTPAIELALENPDIVVVMPVIGEQLVFFPDNVIPVGKLAPAEMQSLLFTSDVYLATTLENHSIGVLEAMQAGVPVIGYDWGGTKETIRNAHDGYLVEPGNIQRLNHALNTTFGSYGQIFARNAKETVTKFTWQSHVDTLMLAYESVLEKRSIEKFAPKVSVVIPCYNKAEYVGATIKSALEQNFDDYEIIVINDGSTDNSLDVIDAAIKDNPNDVPVRVVTQQNANVSVARNHGISLSKSKYVTCLDADDTLHPDFLRRLVIMADANPNVGIAYCDMATFSKNDGQVVPLQGNDFSYEQLLKSNYIPCANVFRRAAFEQTDGYREIHPSWEDYDMWIQITKRGWIGTRVAEPLFNYRVLGDGRNAQSQSLAFHLRSLVNWHNRDVYEPCVSVIIPCYKQSVYLADAIDSVRKQTFCDYEIIVVNDGNNELETKKIHLMVKRFGRSDIRVIDIEKNSGLSNARNVGARAARGEWLTFLDADDMLEPTYLEECLKTVFGKPKKYAYTDFFYWWTGKKQPEDLVYKEATEYSFWWLLVKRTWLANIVIHKSAFDASGGYKDVMSRFGGYEDWELCITLGELGIEGVRVPKPLVKWRQYSKDQMHNDSLRKQQLLREKIRQLHASTYQKLVNYVETQN